MVLAKFVEYESWETEVLFCADMKEKEKAKRVKVKEITQIELANLFLCPLDILKDYIIRQLDNNEPDKFIF